MNFLTAQFNTPELKCSSCQSTRCEGIYQAWR